MKHKQRLNVITLLMLFCLALAFAAPMSAIASASTTIPAGCPGGPDGPKDPSTTTTGNGCGTSVSQDNCGDDTTDSATTPGSAPDLVALYLNPAINLFSSLVGVVVVISIIVGGIQYSMSAGDPQKAARAKGRIMNALIALVAYAFLWAFLQFIVPGGVFH
jgi:hypothetical protein